MTSDVTIKQKAHQNNPIALFVKDIILKNKNRFGIKLPIVIDFVDQLAYISDITYENNIYHIPISKRYTIDAINPLNTKTKNDDYLLEYNLIFELSNAFKSIPHIGIKISLMENYAETILKTKLCGDVIIVPLDKKFKLLPEEMAYIISRIKHFKNKMGIKKKIILEMYDTTQWMSQPTTAYIHSNKNVIYIVFDYNFYKKNKGRLIGNKGLDMLILHELAHTRIPDSKAAHGREFKNVYKKYASEITKNKKIINAWSNARAGSVYTPHTIKESNKNALSSFYYDIFNVYVDIKHGNVGITYNKSKPEMLKEIKEYNKDGDYYIVYLNLPISEKITFDYKIKDINELGILSKRRYNIIVDYFVYKLYEKYGNKKYLQQLKSTNRYKKVMMEYKPILKIVNEKLPKISGNATTRMRNERFVYPKIKI